MSRYIREKIDAGAAALWASAFVLMALIGVQASHLGGAPAQASGVVAVDGMVVLTAASANGEDVLVVLDERAETISVFGVENQRNIRLYEKRDLAELFESANRGGR
jgi:hypothetical protein